MSPLPYCLFSGDCRAQTPGDGDGIVMLRVGIDIGAKLGVVEIIAGFELQHRRRSFDFRCGFSSFRVGDGTSETADQGFRKIRLARRYG